MINKEEFIDFIKNYQNFVDKISKFDMSITGKSYPSILYETDWYKSVDDMLDIFLFSHFTDEGFDLICWWLFENVDKIVYIKKEKDIFNEEEEIKYDLNKLEDLWNFLLMDSKIYFKNV